MTRERKWIVGLLTRLSVEGIVVDMGPPQRCTPNSVRIRVRYIQVHKFICKSNTVINPLEIKDLLFFDCRVCLYGPNRFKMSCFKL